MIRFMKKNKIFSLIIIITLITIISSIMILSLLDNEVKKEISNKALQIMQNKTIQKRIIEKQTLQSILCQNIFLIIMFWILGISMIGIPIILFFYILKILLLTWNIIFLIKYIHWNNIKFILLYLIPDFINNILLLITAYYSISYSILLIKLLFFKKKYPIHQITKNYLKIIIIISILGLIQSLIQAYIFPKIY